MQVLVKKIFQDGVFVGDCDIFEAIECTKFSDSPKSAWLIRHADSENEYGIEFRNPKDANALTGVFVNLEGKGIFIDGTVDDITAKCALCCGDLTTEERTVTPVYNGQFPDFSDPVLKEFTVTRADDGSYTAGRKALYDYAKFTANNSFYRSSRNNGTGITTYKFSGYTAPTVPQGSDTLSQTPLVLASGTAPTPGAGGLKVGIVANGQNYGEKTAATLAALATALNADTAFNVLGTYAVAGSTLTLTTTKVDYVTFQFTAVA